MSPQLELFGPVAVITLRRPEVANRLSLTDLDVFQQHLQAVNRRPEVRVLRLHAQGRHFCSGFHLDELHTTQQGLSAPARFAQVADALEQARPVTVAALQGPVYGGATDLALACDFRLATARFTASVPAVRLGLQFYRSGLQRAVQRLPWPLAQRLYLLGEELGATELQQAGVLSAVLPTPEALSEAMQAWQERLLALAPLALLGVKQALLWASQGRSREAALAAAIDASSAVTEQSADLAEGVTAWQQQRPARFTGQ